MRSAIFISAIIASASARSLLARQEGPCQVKYNQCIATGRAEVACSCDRQACFGEDSARARDYCSSATATLTGTAATGTAVAMVKLGEVCSSDAQCPKGVQCKNTPDLINPKFQQNIICGGYNATCTSNAQCQYNTCKAGLCNGAPITTSSTTTPAPPTSPVVAAPTSTHVKLGEVCSSDAQCPTGVQCKNTPDLINPKFQQNIICGGFNATCASNAQCQYNTCNKGLCNGAPIVSNSTSTASTTTVPTAHGPVVKPASTTTTTSVPTAQAPVVKPASTSTTTAAVKPSSNATTSSRPATSSVVTFKGAADKVSIGGSIIVFGSIAALFL
ncbi:hypothetical protein KVT40_009138 [Elsinoe batatas]|uniref:Uncharacterized protein n=1 Tax=Elsinoe batatas TaxID=2601811 RepID=A0A8K0KV92_9PEZI|nr:hypothetical protein KVT40_009138 [Elsinoe batatas]